jgi:hypothetical protein
LVHSQLSATEVAVDLADSDITWLQYVIKNESSRDFDIHYDRDPLEHIVMVVFSERCQYLYTYDYGALYPPDNVLLHNSVLTVSPGESYSRDIGISECIDKTRLTAGNYHIVVLLDNNGGNLVSSVVLVLKPGKGESNARKGDIHD